MELNYLKLTEDRFDKNLKLSMINCKKKSIKSQLSIWHTGGAYKYPTKLTNILKAFFFY